MRVIGATIVVLSLLAALVALVLAAASPAHAQQGQCGTREAVEQVLAGKYGETRQSWGVAANNMLMITWANPGTGSWTITVLSPQGMMCLVASGQDFTAVHEPAPVPGVPG